MSLDYISKSKQQSASEAFRSPADAFKFKIIIIPRIHMRLCLPGKMRH